MMRLALVAGLALGMLAAPAAVAQTAAVDAARAAGQIGERYDGYIGVAAPVSGLVRGQVTAINIQRRALYSRLAAAKGVSPADVGITAGCELLERVGAGQVYMLSDGAWRRRASGQAVALPAYCR